MPAPHSNAAEIDRLALALAKEPGSKAFIPLAEEYGKAGMWAEAASVLEDGLKYYPGFITAMVALGRAYDQLNQPTKAKAVLEEAIKISPENLRAHRTLAKIYAAEGAKDAALRSCDVILGIIVAGEVLILSIYTIIAPFFDLTEKVVESEIYQSENYTQCHVNAVFITFAVLLVAYNLCLILYGVFLSWMLRNVQWTLFNESKAIAFAMYNLFFFR